MKRKTKGYSNFIANLEVNGRKLASIYQDDHKTR